MDRDERSRTRHKSRREDGSDACQSTPQPRPRITQGQAEVLMKFLNQKFDSDMLTRSPSSFDTLSSDDSSIFEANVQWIADMVVRSVLEGRQGAPIATTPEQRNDLHVTTPNHSPPLPSASKSRDTTLRMPMRGLASIRQLDRLDKKESPVLELPRSPSWDLHETRDQALRKPNRCRDSSRLLDPDRDDFESGLSFRSPEESKKSATLPLKDGELDRGDDSSQELNLDDVVEFSSAVLSGQPNESSSPDITASLLSVHEQRSPYPSSSELSDRESSLSAAISQSEMPSIESFSSWSASMTELVIDSFLSKQGASSSAGAGSAYRNRDIVLQLTHSVKQRGLEIESALGGFDSRRQSMTTTESATDDTDEESLLFQTRGESAALIDIDRNEAIETLVGDRQVGGSSYTEGENVSQFAFLEELLGSDNNLTLDDAVSAVSELSGATELPPSESPMMTEGTAKPSALPPKFPQRMRSLKGSSSFDGNDEPLPSPRNGAEPHPVQSEAQRRPPIVSFSSIELRLYERVLSDNPACSTGPSIGIGWRYHDTSVTLDIDEYEISREGQGRSVGELHLSRSAREQLVREWGYTDREIAANIRERNRVRFGRRQTANNLGAERLEEAIESLRNKVKKASFLHKEQQKQQKQLEKQTQKYREEHAQGQEMGVKQLSLKAASAHSHEVSDQETSTDGFDELIEL
jgi:hypothetical protein